MPRRRGAFWRSLMHEEVVDLRSLAARKAGITQPSLAIAPTPRESYPAVSREEVPIRLSASSSEAATLRTLASLPPEALQDPGITSDEQLHEYAEALQFSSQKRAKAQETYIASSPAAPVHPSTEISSRELAEELAFIEEQDEAFEQSITPDIEALQDIPLEAPATLSVAYPQEPIEYQRSQERVEAKLVGFPLASSYENSLSDELHQKRRNPFRKIFLVALIALLVLPLSGAGVFAMQGDSIQEEALANAYAAYEHMERGKAALLALDHATAGAEFEQAYAAFEAAEGAAGIMSRGTLRVSTLLPFDTKIASAARLLDAGKGYAKAGGEVSLALAQIRSTQNGGDEIAATDAIVEATAHLDRARGHFERANMVLAYVRPGDLPQEFSDDFVLIQQQTHQVELLLNEAYSSLPAVLSMLGHEESKRYLFLFQNNTELRATGGFIGTYGTLTMDDGAMKDLFINGIYDPDGQLKEKIVPPAPLQYVTPNWGTRDSNWFFDFPTSARKAMEFFEKTGNGKVDGVIAITPYVVQELLRITGPVDMPAYGVTVSSDTFLEITQEEVEENYDKELNKPKQILADMAPILIERAISGGHQGELLSVLMNGLEEKHIIAYTNDSDTQFFLQARGWGGHVEAPQDSPNALNDYLAVVVSNIGGAKTDRYTNTAVDSTTRVEQDGSITRTVWISRKHTGGNTSYWWYDRTNTSYVRVYVPRGAQLIGASGFSGAPKPIATDYVKEGYGHDIDLSRVEATISLHEESGTDQFEETGLTVFGNWMVLNPGEERVAHVTYKLPKGIGDSTNAYSLLVQKQPGLEAAYSGALESGLGAPSFAGCQQEDEALAMPRFRFGQTTDMTISCALRR